jgi:hypothetical protein
VTVAATEADPTRDEALREHLVTSGLAGSVATSPRNTLDNAGKLVAGQERYTFGLSDWRDATHVEALDAVRALCGGDPAGSGDLDGPGWIEPEATLAGIALHRDRLSAFVAAGGGRVLLATGHPTGLLAHYMALARALRARGCELATPLDDDRRFTGKGGGGRLGVRFLDGVGCVFDGAALVHTHHPHYMEAMLAEAGGVELVIADHGMAGAAIEAGVPTLSIADVNDPALPLAQARGRTEGVLVIDDNLAPRAFTPVTDRLLAWSSPPS